MSSLLLWLWLLLLFSFRALRRFATPIVSRRAPIPLPPALSTLTMFSAAIHCGSPFLGHPLSLCPQSCCLCHPFPVPLLLLLLFGFPSSGGGRTLVVALYIPRQPPPKEKRTPHTLLPILRCCLILLSAFSRSRRLSLPLFCYELSSRKTSLPVRTCFTANRRIPGTILTPRRLFPQVLKCPWLV